MQDRLYKDYAQAKRVTTAAQYALASTDRNPVTCSNGQLIIAPETLAGTLGMWSTHNALLRRQATALVEMPCKQHGIAIQTLGEYPLFTGLKLVHGEVSDVVIVPAEDDPLVVTGQFPLPQAVQARLRAMERAGVPFDMIHTYIAHEVPSYSVSPHGPIPLEVIRPSAPIQTSRTSERLGIVAHAATVSLLRGLRRTANASVLAVGAATVGASIAAALMLDPLIFGAIADERGMATWFVLAQWLW